MHETIDFSNKILDDIKKNKKNMFAFSQKLTEEECKKVFKTINDNYTVSNVTIMHDWSRVFINNMNSGYFDSVRFDIYCTDESNKTILFQVSFEENLIKPDNPYSKDIVSDNYYTKRILEHVCIFRELFDGSEFLMVPSNYHTYAVKKDYVHFHYTTRTKSTFSFLSKKTPSSVYTDAALINKKKSGWVSSSDSYEKNVFLAVNKQYFESLCSDVEKAVNDIIEQNKSTKLAAFSLNFGGRQIKVESFVGITGVKEDVRNLNSEIIIRIMSDFQKSPSDFTYNENYIETKYLTTAFKFIKHENIYKLVPARSQDTSWFAFRMSENEFNAMMNIAERYTDDVDALMAWRLLGELKE